MADMKVLSAIAPSPWGAATKGCFAGGVLWLALPMVGAYSHIGHKFLELTWPQAITGSALFWGVLAAGMLWGERQTKLSSTHEEAGVAGLCIAAGMMTGVLAMISQVPWPQPAQMQGVLLAATTLTLLVTVWSGWLWRKVQRAR